MLGAKMNEKATSIGLVLISGRSKGLPSGVIPTMVIKSVPAFSSKVICCKRFSTRSSVGTRASS